MKKILSTIIALSMLCLFLRPVTAQSELQLYVAANETELEVGSELILSVYVKNAVDLDKIQFTFNYDKTVLNYTGNVKGEVVKNGYIKTVQKVEDGKLGAIAQLEENPFTGEGLMWEFKFTVLDSARAGTLDYSITNPLFGSRGTDAVLVPDENISADIVTINSNEEYVSLSASADKTEAIAGEDIKYTVSISDATVKGLQFDFDYDESKLEFIDASWLLEDSLMEDFSHVDEIVSALVAFSEETALSGDIFEISFKVKDNAVSGLAEVNLQNIKAQDSVGQIVIVKGEVPTIQINVVDEYAKLLEEIDTWAENVHKLYEEIDYRCVEDLEGAKEEYQLYCSQRDEFEKNSVAWEYIMNTHTAKLSNLYYIDDAIKMYEKDRAAADAVIAKINAIGEVTLESKNAIIEAEEAYELLTDAQKALVKNYDMLKNARKAYESLIVYYECKALAYGNDKIVAVYNANEYSERAIMSVALYNNSDDTGIKRLVKIYTVDVSKQEGEKYSVIDTSEYNGKVDEIKLFFLEGYNSLKNMGAMEALKLQ